MSTNNTNTSSRDGQDNEESSISVVENYSSNFPSESTTNLTPHPRNKVKRLDNLSIASLKEENIRCDKFDKLEIEFKYCKNKSCVGKGAYSEVYEGYYSQLRENISRNDSLFDRLNFLGRRNSVISKMMVAKFVSYRNINEQKYIINEILMLHKMSHPNVIKVYAYHGSRNPFLSEKGCYPGFYCF